MVSLENSNKFLKALYDDSEYRHDLWYTNTPRGPLLKSGQRVVPDNAPGIVHFLFGRRDRGDGMVNRTHP